MNTKRIGNNLILSGVDCLDLALTLDCGQAFRWACGSDGIWHGVAFGKALSLKQNGDEITFFNTSDSDFNLIWKSYFDLERDYAAITKSFCTDELLRSTVNKYYGIRILVQDSWETLCSFIFSSSNNIKRIKGFIARLCAQYGEMLPDGSFAFPTPGALAKLDASDLRALGAGYRDKYIIDAAQKVASGEVDLNKIKTMPLNEARQELMKINGVGVKVADCTLLFGFNRLDAFPIDTWMKKILLLYPNGLPACMRQYAGIAQQYMFHYARENL